jgi:ubiquitin carboxyl-terminal hydrolase 8
MIISGLPNLGNTCYLNTTLQCLYSSRYFQDFLNEYPDILNIKSLYLCMTKNSRSLIPTYIQTVRKIQNRIPTLDIKESNDIHEFILFLFDIFFEEFKTVLKVEKPLKRKRNDILKYNCDAHWFNSYSDVCDLVYSQAVVQTTCSNCEHTHTNYEIISVIPLDISSSSNLGECVDKYFSNSLIEHWVCDKCRVIGTNNTIKHLLRRLPKLLIFSLNRFEFRDGKTQKNNKTINIPNVLDMKDALLFLSDRTKYNLISSGSHVGDVENGHYTANVLNSDKKIIHIDDMRVSEYEGVFDLENSYVVFYELI